MTAIDRLAYLDATLAALNMAWPRLNAELQSRIDSKTLQLIGANDEQVRGAIKALREIQNLPEALHSERIYIKAALSEESDAA